MNNFPALGALLLVSFLTACAPAPPRPLALHGQWRPSPNFDERRANFVVIHHTTDDSAEESLRTLTDPQRRVSAHYLVGRDGAIYQLVDERFRAWHAGESKWGAHTDLNSVSLGIELDNNGREPYADAQISALLALLRGIRERHRIPQRNFLGHADVAPQRKIDPSRYFPWEVLAKHGFGLWCDPPYPVAPSGMDFTLALRVLGYDMSNGDAAIRAFKRHFLKDDTTADLGELERSVLYCLLSKAVE